MSEQLQKQRGPIRILCLDGGGFRTFSMIEILNTLKKYIKKDIYQSFDLICGSGTGGILAILLGVLRMPFNEIRDFFMNIQDDWVSESKGGFLTGIFKKKGNSSQQLEQKLKQLLEAKLNDQNATLGPLQSGDPRVCVVSKLDNLTQSLFRNYDGPQVPIWQAARATSATHPYDPIEIDRISYKGFDVHNPSSVAISEAESITEWSERDKIIVSIGAGDVPHEMYPDISAPDSEADLLERQHPHYYRFIVNGTHKLNATNMNQIRIAAQTYMNTTDFHRKMVELQNFFKV